MPATGHIRVQLIAHKEHIFPAEPTLPQRVLEELRRRLARTCIERGHDPPKNMIETGAPQPRAHAILSRETRIRPERQWKGDARQHL
jgi:hypothetical protein